MRKTKTFEAYLDDANLIRIFLSKNFFDGKSRHFYLKNEAGQMEELRIENFIQDHFNMNEYKCSVQQEIVYGKKYSVYEEHALSTPLQLGFIVKSPEFDEQFAYDGPLGVEITNLSTTFRLWAPTATKVTLVLFDNQSEIYRNMRRGDHGVFEFSLAQNLHLTNYYYLVELNGKLTKTLDPYGISGGANGQHNTIIDTRRLEPNGSYELPEIKSPLDTSIVEVSIRDFTYNIDFPTKSTFKDAMRKGLTLDGHKIGFDYLVDLGATHVQLLPVNDFVTVDEENKFLFYNWGYDPAQYFVLDGSYGVTPNQPIERMNNFKQLVNQFHQHGMRVNLDVVFNHVYDTETSVFDQTVPYYYFRYTENRKLSNGTYCGNDLASEQKMLRRYFVDVLKFYVETYDVDGFRFDLMGILDIETLQEISRVLREIKPDIMLYGEGWNMPTALPDEQKGSMLNGAKIPDYAFFNDFFRDVVKGKSDEEHSHQQGFLTGDFSNIEGMKEAILGINHYSNITTTQSINYVECHDNYTLWDKIKFSCKDSKVVRLLKHRLVLAAVIFSRGIPFIQIGQEFCRSKNGICNSYRSPDAINQVDWNRCIQYADTSRYTKELLQFRKQEPMLRSETATCTVKNVGNVLFYQIEENDELLVVVFNPTDAVVYQEYNEPMSILFNESGAIPFIAVYSIAVNPYSCVVYKRMRETRETND